MTVVIGFFCHDGVVVGADSMLTPSMGGMPVGHHKGQKVHILAGDQVFAFAGDQGQAARLQIMADGSAQMINIVGHPIDYVLALTQALVQQFHNTGIGGQINVNALLGFQHGGRHELCAFEGMMQPRLLDATHYYVALGSGKMSADPFLRFLVDIFCTDGPPSVAEATFLTAWCIKHVCVTNPGGVAEPVRIATIERQATGAYAFKALSDNEVDDQGQLVSSACKSLVDWRDSLAPPNNGAEPDDTVPRPPTAF